jgi:ABC-2 type transport system ATP-binding protein
MDRDRRAATQNILTIRNLRKTYGEKAAVAGISFEVRRGEIVGLLGSNGAGKTTTISMILGVLEPDAGSIQLEGAEMIPRNAPAVRRTNFAAVYAPLTGNLTVLQNLRVFGLLYGVEKLTERIEEVVREMGLERFRRVKCGVLSSGEQTRVALAKAMLNRPHLLLLDEPTASLDPVAAHEIRDQIRKFASADHGGVLWTSHNMLEVQEVCDRVLFLSQGKILLEGDPKALPRAHGKQTLEELFIAVSREAPEVEPE